MALEESSKCYKHSLLAYVALVGDTPELSLYHAKLLDVVDMAVDRPNDAAHELARLGLSLAMALGDSIVNLVANVAETENGAVVIRTRLVAQLEQVAHAASNGLDPCQGQQMAVVSINKALRSLGVINDIDYPDLEKLRP